MNLAHLNREFQRASGLLGWLTAGVTLFALMMVVIYPSFRDQMEAMMKFVPPFLRPLLAYRAGLKDVEGWLAIAYGHPVLLGLTAAWPITAGARAIAGEIEYGTMSWMLAYPLSRDVFIRDKAVVMLVGVVVLNLAPVAGFWLGFIGLGIPHAPLSAYLLTAIAGMLLFGTFGMITLWASAASSEVGRPARLGAGLFLGSLLLDYVAHIWVPARKVQFLSPFAYYAPTDLLGLKAMRLDESGVMLALLLLTYLGALWTFRRRDLSI